MPVGITKVHTASAAAMVDLHVLSGVWPAAISETLCLNAREDRFELRFADLERIVMNCNIVAVSKIQRQCVIHLHGREIMNSTLLERQSENSREEFCRRDFVVRRHDGVVEFNRHNKPPYLL